MTQDRSTVEPHEFTRRPWRYDKKRWLRLLLGASICHHCFAPRRLHPRTAWVKARPFGENYYLSTNAPHFKEGW